MNILVTGCCGFIGYHLVLALLKKKINVYGIDNLCSVSKKTQNIRLRNLRKINFKFEKKNLVKKNSLNKFNNIDIDIIIHLAAQPGVRFSQEYPSKTIDSNILAYSNILEFAKKKKVKKILFASSSSVYGETKTFRESSPLFKTNSIYASTKLYNEILSYTYHYLYKINFIAMRFFSVYGPFGREDMAYYKFLKQIEKNKTITIYGDLDSMRSYTYIDDVINKILKLINFKKEKNYFEVFNIGNKNSSKLSQMIKFYQSNLNKTFTVEKVKRNKSDVLKTVSSNQKFNKYFGKTNNTSLENGLSNFLSWYKSIY